MKKHRFKPHSVRTGRKAGRKLKRICVGSRNPGSMDQGSIRRPF